MTALDYAIDKNLVDMTIRQWLDSEQWTPTLGIDGFREGEAVNHYQQRVAQSG